MTSLSTGLLTETQRRAVLRSVAWLWRHDIEQPLWIAVVGSMRQPDSTLHYDGAVYNPQTRTWRPLPASPLSGRVGPAAVWTGTRVVIWGGYDNVNSMQVTADRAAYDPTTNSRV